jgi:hypothetical protein
MPGFLAEFLHSDNRQVHFDSRRDVRAYLALTHVFYEYQ